MNSIKLRIKTITTIILVFLIQFTNGQNVKELDNKAGFKDIKIGKPISELIDKVKKDEKVNVMYLIEDVSKYEIESHKIDKIIITVSNDDNEIIESISFMFVDRIDELVKIARDRNANIEKRNKALKEAERLSKKELEYTYYERLFSDAFGKPTQTKIKTKKWIGSKIQLMCTNSNGVGFCVFSKVLTKEEQNQIKKAKGINASSKF
ncbi:hypothetical protein [Tenacibaculum maritimum]|uniref:hypothetical protein n=1 Tax=Tenacibaculum maritimum TaxID=107401 RepID=UPI0038766422